MKRIIALLAAAMLLAMTCTACSDKTEDSEVFAINSVTIAESSDDWPVESSEEMPEESFDEPLPLDSPAATENTFYNIRKAAWEDVQWTTFTCPYFTIQVPEGWTVDWNGNAHALFWQVYDPETKMRGISNIDHMTAAKSEQVGNLLGMRTLTQGTVQEYFEDMFRDGTEYFTVENSCVPGDKDYLQSLRNDKQIWDYEALYAKFSQNGVEGEGIYSAVIMEAPDLVLTGGINYAMWEINGTFTEYAPLGELVKWLPVYREMAQSFTYTDLYWNELIDIINTPTDITTNINDPDPVMEAFEERSREDTIRQEKISDMIGEYERVYDNDTGEIYRAYNGFLDDLGPDQTQFSSITDDQYTEGYVGWIDK